MLFTSVTFKDSNDYYLMELSVFSIIWCMLFSSAAFKNSNDYYLMELSNIVDTHQLYITIYKKCVWPCWVACTYYFPSCSRGEGRKLMWCHWAYMIVYIHNSITFEQMAQEHQILIQHLSSFQLFEKQWKIENCGSFCQVKYITSIFTVMLCYVMLLIQNTKSKVLIGWVFLGGGGGS